MKVLMLGWEYPPHITGGLGTACEGLTTALAKHDVSIRFVVPHLFGGEQANHMTLMDSVDSTAVVRNGKAASGAAKLRKRFATTRIPSLLSPYLRPETFRQQVASLSNRTAALLKSGVKKDATIQALIDGEVYGIDLRSVMDQGELGVPFPEQVYGHDIFDEVERFTANVLALMGTQDFDVIHAHDWMTFPAGVALSQISGKPLVVHVHSLEYDRSGIFVNEQINQIEKFGLEAATNIVAVSYYTQRSIEKYHGIPPRKISVIHNGVYSRQAVQAYRMEKTWPRRVVLFLGRVTFQKGPDYFVEVASRVVPHVPDVLFVLAGSGDMLPRLINRVQELGLSDNFHFPGFLRGEEVEEMFSVADLYVMPSVSEPFGITALEAISFDTPVIISRTSGVSEVLGHALKSDFWDLDRLADLIINGLLHEELRQDMISMAREEVRRLHWDAAAIKTLELYDQVVR